MARNQNRRQIVSNAIKARKPPQTGGTTAPRSAGQGVFDRQQLGGRWNPKGQTKNTEYAKSQRSAPAGGAPPAATPYTPTPWNSKADQIVAGAQKSYLDASGNFDLAEQNAKQEFGLDPGFNDYKVNPNSRAALLEETYLKGNRGITNSAGLQLYSGSTSNRLGANRTDYGVNRDQLAKTYRDALGEISAGRTKAAEEKAEKEREAEWERISAAESAEPEAEAAPAGKKAPRKQQTKQAISKARKAR
jgi:hypothetical protein